MAGKVLTNSRNIQNVFGTGEEKNKMAKILEVKQSDGNEEKTSLIKNMKRRMNR